MNKLDRFLYWFHDGRESEYDKMLSVFNTTRNFLKIVVKYNQQEDVDISYIPTDEWERDPELMDFLGDNGFISGVSDYNNLEDDEVKNRFLIWSLNNDETSTLNFIASDIFNDVDIEKDGYYVGLRDRDDLSYFFESYGRDASPRDLAKAILAEDDFFDRWWDTTDNVYRDVID